MEERTRLTIKSKECILYKPTNTYHIKAPSARLKKVVIESYEVDTEKLRVALREIEKAYYSSEIRLERIKKRKVSEIIRMKLPALFDSCRQRFAKY